MGERTFDYLSTTGSIIRENYTQGALAGHTLHRDTDSLQRVEQLRLTSGSTTKVHHKRSYDAAGRLKQVEDALHDYTAQYDYAAGSFAKISGIAHHHGTTHSLQHSRSYDGYGHYSYYGYGINNRYQGGGVVVASQRLGRYQYPDGSRYENWLTYSESRLQFEWGPTNDKDKPGPLEDAKQRYGVTYLVVFFPDDNPFTDADESEDIQVLDTYTCDGQTTQSPIKTFSPQALIPGKTGLVVLLPVQINEVSFDGDKYWELWADDCGATYAHQVPAEKKYSRPHWRDFDGNGKPDNKAIGERNYAVAFTRNTRPHIGAKFKIAGASHFGTIKVKATGTDGVSIPETLATVFGDDVTLPLTEASSALVKTIKFYDKKDDAKAFKLECEVKIGNSDWSKIGITKHTVYVTLDDPSPMKDFNGNNVTLRQETLFEIGCRNADGETDQAGATAKIWSEFTDRVVKRIDGTQMTYYDSYLCANSEAASLLKFGDGQCGAWADLLIRTRQVQGMNDTNEYRFFFSNQGPGVEGFTVKDWTFHGAGTSGNPAYPYLNILPIGNPDAYIGQNSYNFAYAEVTDDNGIAGQGNPNPASLFNNHQVMVSGEYYDPSYGIKRASLADIDNRSIAGFYKVDQIPLNEAAYNLDLNQDGDKVDTGEFLLSFSCLGKIQQGTI